MTDIQIMNEIARKGSTRMAGVRRRWRRLGPGEKREVLKMLGGCDDPDLIREAIDAVTTGRVKLFREGH